MKNKNSAHAMTASPCLEKVLGRLDGVKPAGAGRWMAFCSAHPEKNQSLSIREAADGKVLLHCFAGCTARDITAAIGLELRDLFPSQQKTRRGPSKDAVRHERAVYEIGVSMQLQGCRLNEQDQARFELAKQRLGVSK